MNKKTAFIVEVKLFERMASITMFNDINVPLVVSVFYVEIGFERIVFGLNTQEANKPIFNLLKNMVVV